jgi:AcrR family transcriptional regulator
MALIGFSLNDIRPAGRGIEATPATDSTRARLLDAALNCIASQGFGALRMEDVRAAACVSNGSLYHHFPTRLALADALYARTLRDFQSVFEPFQVAALPAQAAVTGMVRAYIAWVLAHPMEAGLLHELRRDQRLDGAPGEWLQVSKEGFRSLASWVEARARAGELLAAPIDVWIALVLGPSMQLTPVWLHRVRAARDSGLEVAIPEPTIQLLAQSAWAAVQPQ